MAPGSSRTKSGNRPIICRKNGATSKFHEVMTEPSSVASPTAPKLVQPARLIDWARRRADKRSSLARLSAREAPSTSASVPASGAVPVRAASRMDGSRRARPESTLMTALVRAPETRAASTPSAKRSLPRTTNWSSERFITAPGVTGSAPCLGYCLLQVGYDFFGFGNRPLDDFFDGGDVVYQTLYLADRQHALLEVPVLGRHADLFEGVGHESKLLRVLPAGGKDSDEQLPVRQAHHLGYRARVRYGPQVSEREQPALDRFLGGRGVLDAAPEPVEILGVEGVVDVLLDRELLEVLVQRALHRGHQARAHRHALSAKGQHAGQPAPVANAAGRNHRDVDHVGDAGHQAERGGRLAVGGRLVAGYDDTVRAVILCALGVARVGHGREHLAAVLVRGIHYPIALAQREVDPRHLLL